MEGYLQELYTFTIESFKTLNPSIQYYSAMLLQVWTRIYTESVAMSLPAQSKIEEILALIIQNYLEETIKVAGMNSSELVEDDNEDEDENFQKEERTQKNENLEYLSRLMR